MVARDADYLAAFYRDIFECEEYRPPRVLAGEKVSLGNGLPGAEIYSIWLKFPNLDRPFSEILEYTNTPDQSEPGVNEPGFSHLSFETQDIHTTFAAILKAGGAPQGEITNFGSADKPFQIVYVRDPEGNILELEQPYFQ